MEFKAESTELSVSVFLPGSTTAVSATSDGSILLWEQQGKPPKDKTARAPQRQGTKLIRLHDTAITYLTTVNGFLVTGGADGYVRFYDGRLRLTAWFENMEAGEIRSISFLMGWDGLQDIPEEEAGQMQFSAPDFVVSTNLSKVILVKANDFNDLRTASRGGDVLVEGMLHDAAAVAAHPVRPELLVAGASGRLQVWQLGSWRLLQEDELAPGARVVCACWSRQGDVLALGLESGDLQLLTDQSFKLVAEFKHSKKAVHHVAVSSTGRHVAAAGADHSVMLYELLPFRDSSMLRWEYIGRNKAHTQRIVGLAFGESPSGATKLCSLGQDARLVEYDVAGSSPQAGLRVAAAGRACPTGCTPTAMTFAPPLAYFEAGSSDTLLIVADDSYKLRIYCMERARVVSTYQGPMYSSPAQQLLVFKSEGTGRFFVAYNTGDKVVGLLSWPNISNPALSLGLIAHPGPVTSLDVSHDGRQLITANGHEGIVNIWETCDAPLKAASKDDPDNQPYMQLLDAATMEEARNFIDYAQIKAQDQGSLEARRVDGAVDAAMAPNIMRAMEYHLSNMEIQNMAEELKYKAGLGQKKGHDCLSVQELLGMYANYRPVTGLLVSDLEQAFLDLGANPQTGRLSADDLTAALTTLGELMPREELEDCMLKLTGQKDALSVRLTEGITAADFAETLGFREGEYAA